MAKKYYIITYGCQMNVHESEKLAGILEARGYLAGTDEKDANIVVFNTCCIRENAENRVLGNLGHVKKLKEENPGLIVAVCGCMTQQKGAAERLKTRCPFVNIIFGTHNLYQFDRYLEQLQSGKNIIDVWETEGETVEGTPVARSKGVGAWVNIMYGCDNYCAYCIVPYVRGRERSRNPEAVTDEIKKLLDNGYQEITLLGQNVNSYRGADAKGNEIDFAKLLEKAANLGGKYRVRFMTSHPKDFSDSVIRTIADNPNIPDFIHLPAQSGSDRILSLMNRKYTRSDYLNRIEIIRKFLPNAGLSGDLMVGFPSETEDDFLDTLRLCEAVQYSNLYTFCYSRRKGTRADEMENQILETVKTERIMRLIQLQAEIGVKLTKADIGKKTEVLCDTHLEKSGTFRGKTTNGKLVLFKSNRSLVGKFVPVIITGSRNTNLTGRIIED